MPSVKIRGPRFAFLPTITSAENQLHSVNVFLCLSNYDQFSKAQPLGHWMFGHW